MYFCRKGFHALNFQCVVDAHGRFTWLGGGVAGSAWDGSVVRQSSLPGLLDALPAGYFITADSGYGASGRWVRPFKGVEARKRSRAIFNNLQAQTRGPVEKAFGVLKATWRWMLKGVPMGHPTVYTSAFLTACIVHNMIVDKRIQAHAPPLPNPLEYEDDTVGLTGSAAVAPGTKRSLVAFADAAFRKMKARRAGATDGAGGDVAVDDDDSDGGSDDDDGMVTAAGAAAAVRTASTNLQYRIMQQLRQKSTTLNAALVKEGGLHAAQS